MWFGQDPHHLPLQHPRWHTPNIDTNLLNESNIYILGQRIQF